MRRRRRVDVGWLARHEWRWERVPSAVRRRSFAQEIKKLREEGRTLSPVAIEGRAIARTFWGQAWCRNLERYSDFANRLPRGRTYVRRGSVLDLQIEPGAVRALVHGTWLYQVEIRVAAVSRPRWSDICRDCAGGIDSLVELLQGRLSKAVMERICEPQRGLFPAPAQIQLQCSCPDWAEMCKHVAAVLYGIGARLDAQPELLFLLRKVDAGQLIAKAGSAEVPLAGAGARPGRVLQAEGLAELFGLEMAPAGAQGRRGGRPAGAGKATQGGKPGRGKKGGRSKRKSGS